MLIKIFLGGEADRGYRGFIGKHVVPCMAQNMGKPIIRCTIYLFSYVELNWKVSREQS